MKYSSFSLEHKAGGNLWAAIGGLRGVQKTNSSLRSEATVNMLSESPQTSEPLESQICERSWCRSLERAGAMEEVLDWIQIPWEVLKSQNRGVGERKKILLGELGMKSKAGLFYTRSSAGYRPCRLRPCIYINHSVYNIISNNEKVHLSLTFELTRWDSLNWCNVDSQA